MDENSLRDMLERATREEPPMGRLSVNALRQGIRLRRRRRAQGAASATAAVLLVAAMVPVITGHGGVTPAAGISGPAGYVAISDSLGSSAAVVPFSLTTSQVGQPVRLPNREFGFLPQLAATPNGRTVWVTNSGPDLTPIDTATNETGQPVNVHQDVGPIVVTPNGQRAYVLTEDGHVIPVSLRSRTVHKTIRVPSGVDGLYMSPTGSMVYVLSSAYPYKWVTAIRTATDTAFTPINMPNASSIVFSQNGGTAYVVEAPPTGRSGDVVPISTGTDRPGKPIRLDSRPLWSIPSALVAPGGKMMYILTARAKGKDVTGWQVTPVNLATGTSLSPFSVPGYQFPQRCAISRDGRDLYVSAATSSGRSYLYVFSTVTHALVRRLALPGQLQGLLAVSPSGRTVYVSVSGRGSERSMLIPFSTSTYRQGAPIVFPEAANAMVFAR